MLFNLNELAGGAAAEKIDKAIKRVLENMQDPNTSARSKRKVIITITFDQDENRSESTLDISVAEKLASEGGVRTRIGIGKDLDTGEVYAEEYRPISARQIGLDEAELSNRIIEVAESGEVISDSLDEGDESSVQESKVLLKFRKAGH